MIVLRFAMCPVKILNSRSLLASKDSCMTWFWAVRFKMKSAKWIFFTANYFSYWKVTGLASKHHLCNHFPSGVWNQCLQMKQPPSPMNTKGGRVNGVSTWMAVLCWAVVAQLCPTLCKSMDCSWSGSSVHGDTSGKNTGCHALLQGIFPIQGLNPGLLHCRWILHHLSYQGSPDGCPVLGYLKLGLLLWKLNLQMVSILPISDICSPRKPNW